MASKQTTEQEARLPRVKKEKKRKVPSLSNDTEFTHSNSQTAQNSLIQILKRLERSGSARKQRTML